jgi:hypothetical protein
VSSHTSLPEDSCVHLLVKYLGKRMAESVVREEAESLNIWVQRVMQLRPGCRKQDPPPTDRLLTPPFILSELRGPEVSKVRFITHFCSLREMVETYTAPKGLLQCKRFQRLRQAAQLWIRTPVRRVWGLAPLWWMSFLSGSASVLQLWGQPYGEILWLCEMERSEGSYCKAGA